jgi:hypothetical protein
MHNISYHVTLLFVSLQPVNSHHPKSSYSELSQIAQSYADFLNISISCVTSIRLVCHIMLSQVTYSHRSPIATSSDLHILQSNWLRSVVGIGVLDSTLR